MRKADLCKPVAEVIWKLKEVGNEELIAVNYCNKTVYVGNHYKKDGQLKRFDVYADVEGKRLLMSVPAKEDLAFITDVIGHVAYII